MQRRTKDQDNTSDNMLISKQNKALYMLVKTTGISATLLTIGETGMQTEQLPAYVDGMELNLLHVKSMDEAHELIQLNDIGLVILRVDKTWKDAANEIERMRRFCTYLETLVVADLSSEDLPTSLLKDGVDFVAAGTSSRVLTAGIGSMLSHRAT